MARDEKIYFKLTSEKKAELEEIADAYGLTMSGLCAFVMGQWLHQQKHVMRPMMEGIQGVVKQAVESELERLSKAEPQE